MSSIFDNVLDAILRPGNALFSANDRIFWMYLVAALGFMVFVYVRQEQTRSVKSFVAYAFPKDVYRHKSSLADYQFLLVALTVVGLMAPWSASISSAISSEIQGGVARHVDLPVLTPSRVVGTVLYTLWITLALDFSLFFSHYLQHRVPWLWEFHKTHHSAERLNPLTVYRMHPLDSLFGLVVTGVIVGLLDGSFRTFVHGPFAQLTLLDLNVAFFVFYLLGYNLRHTHVWLDYGPRWSKVFVSPAQHQVHHSVDEQHFDKNMGFLFSFWDSLFGTLYVPKGKEKIDFGLNRAGEHEEYHSVWALLMKPFNKLGIHSVVVIVVLLVGLGAWVDWRLAPPGWLASKKQEKLMLADLTSPELKQLVTSGTTTVLVPTGGVEQGGAHLALGKHNYVVDYTAREIARELGHTLVAPVLPFSPAGNPDPPTQHMIFPGTMSLPGPQFAAVVEAEARSLKQAGFKLICILPDHGESVPLQDEVATKLTQEWRGSGVRVVSIDDYYANNGQDQALESEGYSAPDIGQHAGMKDTSELWRVDPDGVRPSLREESHDFDHTGVDGDPRKASPDLGDRLLRMKIDAAVAQVRGLQKDPARVAGQ